MCAITNLGRWLSVPFWKLFVNEFEVLLVKLGLFFPVLVIPLPLAAGFWL